MRGWSSLRPCAKPSIFPLAQPFFLRTTGVLPLPSAVCGQRRWATSASDGVKKRNKAGDKRPSKRSSFDAGRKEPHQAHDKKVHILEARDRVLSRVRDKKREAAETKSKQPKKDEGKGKEKKKSAKSKEEGDKSGGAVEVVGDGAPVVQPRRVAATIAVKDVEQHEQEQPAELQPPMTLDDVVGILREEKGLNLMVLDVAEKCNFAHYMVILEGRSGRHLRAMAERIMEEVHSPPPRAVCVVAHSSNVPVSHR
jgi:hypothetical protein